MARAAPLAGVLVLLLAAALAVGPAHADATTYGATELADGEGVLTIANATAPTTVYVLNVTDAIVLGVDVLVERLGSTASGGSFLIQTALNAPVGAGGASLCSQTSTPAPGIAGAYTYATFCGVPVNSSLPAYVYVTVTSSHCSYRLTALLRSLSYDSVNDTRTTAFGIITSGAGSPIDASANASAALASNAVLVTPPTLFPRQQIAMVLPRGNLVGATLQIFSGTNTSLPPLCSFGGSTITSAQYCLIGNTSVTVVFTRVSNTYAHFALFYQAIGNPTMLDDAYDDIQTVNIVGEPGFFQVFAVDVPDSTVQLYVRSITQDLVVFTGYGGVPLPSGYTTYQYQQQAANASTASVSMPATGRWYIAVLLWQSTSRSQAEVAVYTACAGDLSFANITSGLISDGSGPNLCFLPNRTCTWAVSAPPSYNSMFLYVSRLSTTQSNGQLYIYNGVDATGTLLLDAYGTGQVIRYFSNTSAFFVQFVAGNVQPGDTNCIGFSLQFTMMNAAPPVIDTAALQFALDPADAQLYSTTVTAGSATTLRAEFSSPDAAPLSIGCAPGQSGLNSHAISYGGYLSDRSAYSLAFPSTAAGLYYCVLFSTSPNGATGVVLSRPQSSCGGTLTPEATTLWPMISGSVYPSSATCTTVVRPSTNATFVTATLNQFQLATPTDTLEIYDDAGRRFGRYTASSPPPAVMTFVSSSVRYVLTAAAHDASATAIGFSGAYTSLTTVISRNYLVTSFASGNSPLGPSVMSLHAFYPSLPLLSVTITPAGGLLVGDIAVYIGNGTIPTPTSYWLRVLPSSASRAIGPTIVTTSTTSISFTFATAAETTYFIGVFSADAGGAYLYRFEPVANPAGAIAGAVVACLVIIAVVAAVSVVVVRRRRRALLRSQQAGAALHQITTPMLAADVADSNSHV